MLQFVALTHFYVLMNKAIRIFWGSIFSVCFLYEILQKNICNNILPLRIFTTFDADSYHSSDDIVDFY